MHGHIGLMRSRILVGVTEQSKRRYSYCVLLAQPSSKHKFVWIPYHTWTLRLKTTNLHVLNGQSFIAQVHCPVNIEHHFYENNQLVLKMLKQLSLLSLTRFVCLVSPLAASLHHTSINFFGLFVRSNSKSRKLFILQDASPFFRLCTKDSKFEE